MAQSPIWFGDTDIPHEAPNSPEWDFGLDKTTCTRTFGGTYETLMANRPSVGSFGTGIYAGLRVTSVKVTHGKGNQGFMVWVLEGALTATPTLPIDDPSITFDKQEYALALHPRYSGLSHTALDRVTTYIESTDEKTTDQLAEIIGLSELETELADKMLRGQTHFALYLPVYKWVTHFLTEPVLDPGGYPETPWGPLTPPASVDWLREADTLSISNGFYQLTRSWLGTLVLDTDIYPVF